MPDNVNTAEAVATTPTVRITGDPDMWRLLCKASVAPIPPNTVEDFGRPGWMKSTKAMSVPGGVVLQVTSEHRSERGYVTASSEALTFIPGVVILDAANGPHIAPA